MKRSVGYLYLICLCIVCLLAPPLAAEPIYLVKDIETEGIPFQVPSPFPSLIEAFGGLPFGLAPAGDRLIFLANDRVHGFEPWVSDGTAAGTMLLRDTCVGDCGVDYQLWINAPQGLVFFSGEPDERGVWTSDGTTAGTEPFVPTTTLLHFQTDIVDLGDTSYSLAERNLVSPQGPNQPPETIQTFCEGTALQNCETALRQEGDVLYVAEWVQLAVSNRIVRIWANDGTVGETELLAEAPANDLEGMSTLLLPDGRSLVTVSFRAAIGSLQENLLIRTDGTSAGTEILDEGSDAMRQLAANPVLRDGVVYLADVGGNLWSLQGTNIELVTNLPETPAKVLSLRRGLLVTLSTSDIYQHELWSIDLQKGEGQRIPDFLLWHFAHPPDMDLTPRTSVSAEWNGLFFFPGSGRGTGEEMWVSDGSSAGTRLVQDLFPGSASSFPAHLTVAGDRLYFAAEAPGVDRELFAIDLESFDCSATGGFTPTQSTACLRKALQDRESQPTQRKP